MHPTWTEGYKCCPPPTPSGASAPGERERERQTDRQTEAGTACRAGVPLPTPTPQELSEGPQGLQGTTVFQGQHGPCVSQSGPKEAPHTGPNQGLQWKWHLALSPGGRIYFAQQRPAAI